MRRGRATEIIGARDNERRGLISHSIESKGLWVDGNAFQTEPHATRIIATIPKFSRGFGNR